MNDIEIKVPSDPQFLKIIRSGISHLSDIGGFSKEDLFLLLAIGSLNPLKTHLHIILCVVFSGFLMAFFYLSFKGLLWDAIKATFRLATFQGKMRDESGKVAPIHELTIPYSPAVGLGVLAQNFASIKW